MANKWPVKVHVEIDPGALKYVAGKGEATQFVETFSIVVAEQVRESMVNKLATAAVEKGGGMGSLAIGFDIDDEFGTGPHPYPWPHRWELFKQLRMVVNQVLTEQGVMRR